MIRVTEHTRRKAGGRCCKCPFPIEPGERYRQLVQVGETDIWAKPFGRWDAHVHCAKVGDDAECWALTADVERAKAQARVDAEKAVADWNRENGHGPVAVRYWPWLRTFDTEGATGTTSGPAFLNAAGRPTVHIQGCSTMALTHVEAL